jgi:hypothetical protein
MQSLCRVYAEQVGECNVLILPGFSFEATVLHHLSFLDCDFVLPSIPPSAALPVLSLSLLDLGDQALAVMFFLHWNYGIIVWVILGQKLLMPS